MIQSNEPQPGVRESVIAKCKKLLALARDKGASVPEAESASALMAALLAKHSLSMADLETGTYGEGFAEQKVQVPYTAVPRWVVHLSTSIAAPLDITVMCGRTLDGSSVLFLGRTSDAEVAAYFFDWLHGLLPRAAATQRPPTRFPARWREAFLMAAAETIGRRMEAEKRQAMREAEAAAAQSAEAPSGTADAGAKFDLPLFEQQVQNRVAAIVRVKTAGMDRWIAHRFPRQARPRKVKMPDDFDVDGFFAGLRYGRDLPLKKGIGVAQACHGEAQRSREARA